LVMNMPGPDLLRGSDESIIVLPNL
jgi:hypothetical protein